MSSHGRLNRVSILLGCAGLLIASSAYGQQGQPGSTPGQPSKTKVVRRPIVDLKKQADEPRPGQVLQGQPQPTSPQPAAPQPATPAATTPAQPAQPETAPAATPPAEAPAPQSAPTQPTPTPPAAPQPTPQPLPPQEQPRPVDLPETTATAPTSTPAARVTKPLKPAPIPVSAGPDAESSGGAPPASGASTPASPPAAPPAPLAPQSPGPAPVPNSTSAVVVEQPPPPPVEAMESLPDTAPPPLHRAVVAPDASRPATESRDPARVVTESTTAAALSQPAGEPVHAKVTGIDGPADVIQWRVDDGEWMNLVVNDTATGVIEVRTGLGAAVSFILADQVSVKVSRLSRVRLEQRTPEKPGLPIELVVNISRGEVDIKPLPMTPGSPAPAVVRIVTPDKNFTTRLATGVRLDAFTGTRLRTVSGE